LTGLKMRWDPIRPECIIGGRRGSAIEIDQLESLSASAALWRVGRKRSKELWDIGWQKEPVGVAVPFIRLSMACNKMSSVTIKMWITRYLCFV